MCWGSANAYFWGPAFWCSRNIRKRSVQHVGGPLKEMELDTVIKQLGIDSGDSPIA